jgi:broad specificity phosphatase PhoE
VSGLYLVRHAEVALDLERPSRQWQLTEQGRADAAELAGSRPWAEVTTVASSPELKARDTAAPVAEAAGSSLLIENDLREVERPQVRDGYEELVRRYLTGGSLVDWEPREAARARFAGAVARLVGQAAGDVVVVTHGLVISLYLGLSFEQWRQLPLPALIET